MLKNIKLHLHQNEDLQKEREQKLAQDMAVIFKKNINGFQRFLPNLLPIVRSDSSTNISVFCNKDGECNLVDYGQGRTLYGFQPRAESIEHVKKWAEHAIHKRITHYDEDIAKAHSTDIEITDFTALSEWRKRQNYTELPKQQDCLVILGIGLGHHLKWLIENYEIRHLVIYEPEIQFFQSSCRTLDWSEIFGLARDKNVALYLQLGKDSRDLIADITQLLDVDSFEQFYIYQHYHHPIFRDVMSAIQRHSWQYLVEHGISFETDTKHLDYLPTWQPYTVDKSYSALDGSDPTLQDNLQGFKKFFPVIYQEFKNYTPIKWLPVKNSNNEVNILHKATLTTWYSESPRFDCHKHYENFNLQPNKDGLVLGYTGKKLRHYEHYKFVAEAEKLLKEVEEIKGSLPDTIKSIIVFGLGSAYQIETLLTQHCVEKLFICEPNRDFFYASLFAIPWAKLLEEINTSGNRIYLNIGDDGSNLVHDLMDQFHSIGPYILNNTYFYQSYYNSNLTNAIAQLREQLQIIIAFGEYFDHAWHGIQQTKSALANNAPLLLKNARNKLSVDEREVPVFIVGNGPSIDFAIEYLHEYRNQVILVSCGTVLKVLHRHNITPDFHAEIEQNRTTYDWAVLIDDLNYLKQISLLSCNGIHPDTMSLYKDTYIVFKYGESSTVAATKILGENIYETLEYAFPTVTNFAFDFFTQLGFANLYLVGVDLGFIDKRHHHSKLSSYYVDGEKELYDYSKENNVSMLIPGNFRPMVNTKHEFKISRLMIEKKLSILKHQTQVYNTSDGAKIIGTFPLRIENLLVTTSPEQREETILSIKHKAFFKVDGGNFEKQFNNKYESNHTISEIDRLIAIASNPPSSICKAEKLLEKQKLTLFSSYERDNNLLFYYLYGTLNFTNAFLSKLLSTSIDSNDCINNSHFVNGLAQWKELLLKIRGILIDNKNHFDRSHFNLHQRELSLVRYHSADSKVLVVTNSVAYLKNFKHFNEFEVKSHSQFTFCNLNNIPNWKFDYVIYNLLPELDGVSDVLNREVIQNLTKGVKNTFVYVYERELELINLVRQNSDLGVSFISFVRDRSNTINNSRWVSHQAFLAMFVFKILFEKPGVEIYIPKYFLCENNYSNLFTSDPFATLDHFNHIIDFKFHLSCSNLSSSPDLISICGTRGYEISRENLSKIKDLRVYTCYSRKDYLDSLTQFQRKIPELTDDKCFTGLLTTFD